MFRQLSYVLPLLFPFHHADPLPCPPKSHSTKIDMAAFTSALDRRRQDYQILRLGLNFPRPLSSASLTSAPLSSSSTVSISVPPTSSASSVSSGTLTSGAGTGAGTGTGTAESGVTGQSKEEAKLEEQAETINPVFEEFWPEVKDKLLTLEDCHLLVCPQIPFSPLPPKPEISRKARSHLTSNLCLRLFFFSFPFLFIVLDGRSQLPSGPPRWRSTEIG